MASPAPQFSKKELIQLELVKCYASPLRWVTQFLPWGEPGPLVNFKGPDKWQTRTLLKIEAAIRKGIPLGDPAIRLAVASGHGIGKTALVAWLILWFISTRPTPQIIVTANTQTQLRTKTWRELAKWQDLCTIGHWFIYTGTQFKLKDRQDTWFATAVPWSASNSSAFAGTHEAHVLVLFDEASEIDDIIWEVSEGAMTTPGAMWFVFGNPTSNTGRFRQCWTKFRKRWLRDKVDSRDAMMADKAQINEWIEDYGLDSDFVKVRVLGEFPSAGTKQFIGSDIVSAAVNRAYKEIDGLPNPHWVNPRQIPRRIPKIMGIDIGSYGAARSIIVMRHGQHTLPKVMTLRDANHNVIAGYIGQAINDWEPDIVFIDATGYGHGVWLLLQQNGFDQVIPIYWGDRSMVMEPLTYYNPRIEIWHRMAKWLETGSIPDDNELFEDIIGPELHFDVGLRMRLESKEDMTKRGLPSPDKGDALALTFAHPVPVALSHEFEEDMEPECA